MQPAADLSKIRLIALDVDGVLTRGDIMYTASGEELKAFNAKDGLGIGLAIKAGLQVALITGRESAIVSHRANELGIEHVYQNVKTKLPVLKTLVDTLGLSMAEVAYMGDDLPDMPPLASVGLACCPNDAVDPVRAACHWVSRHCGGSGAVRELIDTLLAAQGIEALVLMGLLSSSAK